MHDGNAILVIIDFTMIMQFPVELNVYKSMFCMMILQNYVSQVSGSEKISWMVQSKSNRSVDESIALINLSYPFSIHKIYNCRSCHFRL